MHGGRIAAIVEVDCETDFVARTDEFKTLVHEIAMQVASMNPKWARPEDVPEAETARKREEFVAAFEQDAKNSKKPAEIREKIIDGQLKKYFAELVLTEQTFWRDDSKTVGDLVRETAARVGENVVVRKFARIELGVSE